MCLWIEKHSCWLLVSTKKKIVFFFFFFFFFHFLHSSSQSMNFVAGALLVIFQDVRDELEKEEKVFWIMCAIVEVRVCCCKSFPHVSQKLFFFSRTCFQTTTIRI